MANPNIAALTTAYGNTIVLACSTTTANIVQNASSSNKIVKINTLTVANINTAASFINVEVNQAGTNTFIAKGIAVPANSTVVVIGKDTAIYLLENHSIQLTAGANSVIQAVCSFDEISAA